MTATKEQRIKALAILTTFMRIADNISFERRGRDDIKDTLRFALSFEVPRRVVQASNAWGEPATNKIAPDMAAGQRLDDALDTVDLDSALPFLEFAANAILVSLSKGEPQRYQEPKQKRDEAIRDAGIEAHAPGQKTKSKPKRIRCGGCDNWTSPKKLKNGLCVDCVKRVKADLDDDQAIDSLFDLG